jgi:hypothetical protein
MILIAAKQSTAYATALPTAETRRWSAPSSSGSEPATPSIRRQIAYAPSPMASAMSRTSPNGCLAIVWSAPLWLVVAPPGPTASLKARIPMTP